MIDIPRHIKRLRIVNVEQLALVMAGLFDCDDIEIARHGNYTGWREAVVYRKTIIQAIKLNEIKPLRVFIYDHVHCSTPDDCIIGNVDNLSINSNVVEADFISSNAWAWAEKELSEESLELKNKPASLQPDNFNGKDTAMMIIAGLSVALGKSNNSFKRSGKINQSAIIRAVESAINEYGNGVDVTDRAIRDWVRPALEQHVTKLPT